MSDRGNSRTVYSTATGRICPGCGWPDRDCKCSSRIGPGQAVPSKVVAKLRMEKKGRGGKTVTVVYGLPQNADFLHETLMVEDAVDQDDEFVDVDWFRYVIDCPCLHRLYRPFDTPKGGDHYHCGI